jgi:hypothetical protein
MCRAGQILAVDEDCRQLESTRSRFFVPAEQGQKLRAAITQAEAEIAQASMEIDMLESCNADMELQLRILLVLLWGVLCFFAAV